MTEFSVSAVATIDDSANLTDTPFKRAADTPDRVVLRRKQGAGWRDVTASEFRDEIMRHAKGLMAAGVQQGDRVALMARTRYEWTILDYAIWAAGAVCVPIYETSSAEQVKWILEDSETVGLFVETGEHKETVESVRGELPALANLWTIDDGDLDKLVDSGKDTGDEAVEERRSASVAADVATVIYTSGTTGRPKGCEVTHYNLLGTACNALDGALREALVKDGHSTLLFLPLAHVFARLIEVGVVESGVILGHSPDITNIVPDLESFKPNFILAVPRVFQKVYDRAEQKAVAAGKGKIFHGAAETAIAYSRAKDTGRMGLGLRIKHRLFDVLVYSKLRAAVGGNVTHAVSGGAALGERLGHFFRGVGITIFEGYGLTETTAPATVNTPDHIKIGSVGRPIPGVTVRIADDGEVLVKGVDVFRGYWRNETATAEVLDDGWFHTGDLGTLDSEGFLTITGRKKEILVTAAGKNVAPGPLEDLLRGHALISQAMVVGDARPFIGCLLTLDEEALGPWKEAHGKAADISLADLRNDSDLVAEVDAAVKAANATVSRPESIKSYRILDTDFTQEGGHLTPKLSLKRHVVAKEFADEIEAIYTS